ncbi:MAG TPA: YtxH domain-containing protein [Acidobacteriota bacterium]|nr:YtxH domain-containing protein [Acidobacteriota bacterium]
MSTQGSGGEKLLFLMVGAVIGAVTALLFAPRSGEETRNIIASKVREGTDRIANESRHLAEMTTEYVEKGKELLQHQKDQMAAAFEAGKQAYKKEKEAAKEKA